MSLHTHKRDFSINARLPGISALAVGIGALSTLAAFVLLSLIHLFTNLFFFGSFSFADGSPSLNTLGGWVIFIPVAGGLIVGVMARYGSEKIRGHGIPEAIEAILFGKSRMSPKVAILKPLSSGIVIGSGGPFGAEGPIIMTGGALGSLIAQCVKVTAAERKTLLVAGAASGMTAVFGTPVAAVLLAVELLLFEWRPRSFLPVALACAVAGFARAVFFGTEPLFPLVTAAPGAMSLVSCVIAGLLSGALASGLSAALYKTEDLFGKLPVHWMWWPAIGGLVVGIGGFIEPRALGVGYDVIGDLLHQHIALQISVVILVVKAIIWVVALGSGTSGGVLAPLLMLGAGLGTVLGHVLPGRRTRAVAASLHGSHARRNTRHAADGDCVCIRPHTRQQRVTSVAHCHADRARLCNGRDEAVHHDRENCPARLPHLSGIWRRSARAPLRRRSDVARGRCDRWKHHRA
jgi:H+/Cl- antiporter ClcA